MSHKSTNRGELLALCKDKSVYLGDIDTSLITDMSKLFYGSFRTDFSGIENWDVSKVKEYVLDVLWCKIFQSTLRFLGCEWSGEYGIYV